MENLYQDSKPVNTGPKELPVTPSQLALIRSIAHERGYSEAELAAIVRSEAGTVSVETVGRCKGFEKVVMRLKQRQRIAHAEEPAPLPIEHTPETLFEKVKGYHDSGDEKKPWFTAAESFMYRVRNLDKAGAVDFESFISDTLQPGKWALPPGFLMEIQGFMLGYLRKKEGFGGS